MIEAMACGTPVIAWRCGSVPEVVDEGVSGFIVASEDEALAAVAKLGRIDRRAVRGYSSAVHGGGDGPQLPAALWRLYRGIEGGGRGPAELERAS